jgi:hypothetical protein
VDGAPALRQARLTDVDRVVTGPGRHPLADLRARLHAAHARCEAVDGASWAAYVTDLDRGVDELHHELARVTERPAPGPSLDDVLLARTAALELDAWRLAAAAAGSPDPPALADAGEALARYREGLAAAGPPPRAELETALARLRDTAPEG